MIFLGYGAAAYKHCALPSPAPSHTWRKLEIAGAVFDVLYAANVIDGADAPLPTEWNSSIVILADFDGNIRGGNTSFYLSDVDSLKLKRREAGSFDWIYIFDKKVETVADIAFVYVDYTARAGVEYEYALVSVVGGAEGPVVPVTVKSDFDVLVISDRTAAFATELDVTLTEQRNRQVSVVNTIGRKYPYVIHNGLNNYDSGSCSAYWAKYIPNTDDWDKAGAREYRARFKDFLFNGKPKIMKYRDGRMWLISVSSASIADSTDGGDELIHTSFEWVEIGDCDSGADLYELGLVEGANG